MTQKCQLSSAGTESRPNIDPADREEVARALCCNGICKNDGGSSYSVCQQHTFLEDADAAIHTLISLGWKK